MVFLFFLFISSLARAEFSDYGNELVQTAFERRLYEHSYWKQLLHGAPGEKEELEKTIRAFLTPVETDEISENPATDPNAERQHPQCRYVARFEWISEQLKIDASRLPRPSCKRFKQWRKSIEPDSVSLVFASYYLSNPASMFGHTLLKLNKKGHEGAEILDYGVNYAANVTTKNGFLYAIMGIFGGFSGSFSNFPYYMKVRQYGNVESRDLWEYELNLSAEARHRLISHLWELGHTRFPYYFFKANCSYLVLKLLEVAEPTLNLTRGFRLYAIPSDTVRQVANIPGLVKRVTYRPSLLSQIRRRRLAMNSEQEVAFTKVVSDVAVADAANVNVNVKDPVVLDAAIDYFHFRRMSLDEEFPVNEQQRLNKTLSQRAKLDVEPSSPDTRLSSPPDQGHDSFGATFGGGYADRRGPFLNLWIKPAFHDFMSRDVGYPPLSQILLMEGELRYYTDSQKFSLHRLNLIDVISLTPREELFSRISWKGSLGMDVIRDLPDDRQCNSEEGDCRRIRANFGAGPAWSTGHRLWSADGAEVSGAVFTFYGFAELDASYASGYQKNYRIAPGLSLGGVLDMSSDLRFHAQATGLFPVLGDTAISIQTKLESRYSISRNLDLRVSGLWYHRDWEVHGGVTLFL